MRRVCLTAEAIDINFDRNIQLWSEDKKYIYEQKNIRQNQIIIKQTSKIIAKKNIDFLDKFPECSFFKKFK